MKFKIGDEVLYIKEWRKGKVLTLDTPRSMYEVRFIDNALTRWIEERYLTHPYLMRDEDGSGSSSDALDLVVNQELKPSEEPSVPDNSSITPGGGDFGGGGSSGDY